AADANTFGQATQVDFADDTNPGRLLPGLNPPVSGPNDLSAVVTTSYSSTTLYVTVQVKDNFIDAHPSNPTQPFFNNPAELFMSGSPAGNPWLPPGRRGDSRAFQIDSDTLGNLLGVGISPSSWTATPRVGNGGYTIQFQVALSAISVPAPGGGFTAAGPGSD